MKLIGISLILLLAGCTSRLNGPTQEVKITSNVPNTRIYVDGVDYGTTPGLVTLQRNKQYYLELKAEGYYPYRRLLAGKINPVFYGGIFWAGIPMIYDTIAGTHKQFDPVISVRMPTSEAPIINDVPYNSGSGVRSSAPMDGFFDTIMGSN